MFNFVVSFLHGWYINDTKNFSSGFINHLKILDRDIGLVGNLQNWTSPLYGDYSYAGMVIGPILRTFRIFFGLIFYIIVTIFFLMGCLFWIVLPIVVVTMVILNLLVLIKAPEQVFALVREILGLFNR